MSRAKRILVIPLICCCKRKLSWVPMRGELSELQAAQLAAQLSCWLDAETQEKCPGLRCQLGYGQVAGQLYEAPLQFTSQLHNHKVLSRGCS